MPDPSSVIEKCHRILKPGDLLVIKAQDPSGREVGIFKENQVGYVAPQHLLGFPQHVLLEKSRKLDLK